MHALEHTSVRLWASKARFLIADHVSGKGPAHAELGYGDHADGLDGETKRRLERKLRGKGIGGRDP